MGEVERLRIRFARLLIAILWANAALLLAIGVPADGEPHLQTLSAAGAGLAILTTLAWRADRIGWVTRQVSSIALVGQVMLLVYAFGGHPYQADLHMYFFAMLAVLVGWLDWRIFLPATIAITAHHLILSLVYSTAVFPGGNDLRRVLLHGGIVAVQAGALSWIVWALQEVGVKGIIHELFAPKGDTTGALRWLMIVVFFAAGLLEIVSILFRPVSLSFRLYGNVFAGENMLEAMATLVPGLGWLLPVPFYFMEVLVGLVQALVFMLLTAVFTLLICQHHEEHPATQGQSA